MSKYTTEVRFICEEAFGLSESEGGARVNDIIAGARSKIFDFPFPIFDESYRSVLETKILKHYYTREIGFETVGLWKLKLDTKLNEIMPYYNLFYQSSLLEFNPLYTKDLTRKKDNSIVKENDETENTVGTSTTEATKTNETTATTTDNMVDSVANTSETNATSNGSKSSTRSANASFDDTKTSSNEVNSSVTNNGSTVNTSSGTSAEQGTSNVDTTNKDLYSDTPQGALTGVDNETYLTNARKIINDTDSTYGINKTNSETNNGTTANTETNAGTTNGVENVFGTSENGEASNDITSIADNNVTTGSQYTTRTATNNSTDEAEENTDINVNITNEKVKSKDETTTEDYLERVYGYESGSASKLLKEYRETFLNIDMMVINELEELFLQLW